MIGGLNPTVAPLTAAQIVAKMNALATIAFTAAVTMAAVNATSIGATTPGTGAFTTLSSTVSDAGTTNQALGFTIDHTSSGTPAAGFGTAFILRAKSDTTNSRALGYFFGQWVVATDATRTARLRWFVSDATTDREYMRAESTGTVSMIGFFGAAAVVQPTSTTDLRAALINLGLYASGGATPLDLNGGAFTTSGLVTLTNTTASASTASGALIVSGGGAFAKGVSIGSGAKFGTGTWDEANGFSEMIVGRSGTAALTNTTCSFVGWLDATHPLNSSGVNGELALISRTGGAPGITFATSGVIVGKFKTTGEFFVLNATDATTTATGSISTLGGISAAKALWIGGLANIAGTLTGVAATFTAGITSSGATNGIGYATGAGGAVTQATSKATAVTLSKVCGTITLNGAALAATTSVAFTWTNTAIAATDYVDIQHDSVGTLGAYSIVVTPGAGSATVTVRNNTAGSLSEAIVLRFFVTKAVTT